MGGRHVMMEGSGYHAVIAMRRHRMIITLISVLVVVLLVVGGMRLHTVRVDGKSGYAAVADAVAKTAESGPGLLEAGVQAALANLDDLDASRRIATNGFTLDADAQSGLEQELSIFDSCGYSVSFVLVDMATGETLASYAGDEKYSASAIKGPYILSTAATGAMDLDAVYQSETTDDTYVAQLVENTITVSDNDSYRELFLRYGGDAAVQWASDYGASIDDALYTYFTAEDLARMWVGGYEFLFPEDESVATSSSQARQWLGGLFNDTLNSTINMALADRYTVHTKAGWIDGDGGLYALNDAGIVASGAGDYVLAVLSDACDEYSLLSDLVMVLDDIHTSDM